LLAELGEYGFPLAEQYRRLVADATEQWTSLVSQELAKAPSGDTVASVHALLAAAAVTGRAQDARTAGEYVGSIFDPTPAPAPDLKYRGDGWRALHAQAQTLISRLRPIVEVEFGEARGARGDVRALQSHKLVPIVDAFISTWDLTSTDAAIAAFYRAVGPAVGDEWNTLKQRILETDGLVDRARAWSEQTDKVVQVLRAAHNAGRLDDASVLQEVTTVAALCTDQAHRSLFVAADKVTSSTGLPQQLSLLSSEIPTDVGDVWRFATRAEKALNAIEHSLAERQAAEGISDMEAVTKRVLEAADRFTAAMKGLT